MAPVLFFAKALLKSGGTRFAQVHQDAPCLCRAEPDLPIVGQSPTYKR